jgi:hypothetical protein
MPSGCAGGTHQGERGGTVGRHAGIQQSTTFTGIGVIPR